MVPETPKRVVQGKRTYTDRLMRVFPIWLAVGLLCNVAEFGFNWPALISAAMGSVPSAALYAGLEHLLADNKGNNSWQFRNPTDSRQNELNDHKPIPRVHAKSGEQDRNGKSGNTRS